MDREQMRMAILNQEQIFRQQVHELHRLYHVQKQLMQQAQRTALVSHGPVVVDVKPQLDIWCGEKVTTKPQQQIISFTSCNKATKPAPASAMAEECNLVLTLATGPSSSSSNSSYDAERQQGKRFKASSNCDSGATKVASTSTDSEMARFREVDVAKPARFHGEVCRRMDEMGLGPLMYQCLSLKMV